MKNIYLLLSLLLVSSLLLGQSPGKMNPGRLARIDAWMEQAIVEKQLNGAVAIVHRNNQLVYHKAFGLMDVTSQHAMPKDAIFRIASREAIRNMASFGIACWEVTSIKPKAL